MLFRPFCFRQWSLQATLALSLLWAGTVFAAASVHLTGSVLDPDGRAVVDAAVMLRNETTNQIVTMATDGTGHFTNADIAPGTYTIQVAAPGFDIVQRTGVQITADGMPEVVFKLTLANIQESVTVSAALPAAAVAAPSQSSLMARSAQSLISNHYIRNYTSP